ncbi:hypothetical protein [Algoriphagus sp.]|uniref:hypothetical protein n=1 Tax=Algoriphagus sp. TaxID=1872435 RepID=UPI003F6FCEA1
MNSNDFPILFLTATIRAESYYFVGRPDFSTRENDYIKALNFYKKTGFPILLVDNSMCKSDKIISLMKDYEQFEYLTFQSLHSHLGKGHGEIEIMDYALLNSMLLKTTDLIFKISGRYIVRNIVDFISGFGGFEQQVYINFTRKLIWGDTRLFIMKKQFYQNYFKPTATKYLDEPNDINIERVFARSVHFYMYKGGEMGFWPCYPFYDAHDGSHDHVISFGFFKRIKYSLYFKFKNFSFRHRS